MNSASVTIEIFSYWHAGSGYGKGADCDAVVLKDVNGLPFLPGRSVKGLLREGVRLAEDYDLSLERGATDKLFGKNAPEGDPEGSESGLLSFGSAHLPNDIRAWLSDDEDEEKCKEERKELQEAKIGQRATLFRLFSSTALDEKGMAINKTLRTIEVAIPLTLRASIEVLDNSSIDSWMAPLKKGASLVRALGSHRHRGLGRCRVTIDFAKGAKA